jgi:hypothetical protein
MALRTSARLNIGAFRASSVMKSAAGEYRVGVLYQAIDPPIINGVRKPMKPGGSSRPTGCPDISVADEATGYQDSGADIAWVLGNQAHVPIVTPTDAPDARRDVGWCFPDHEDGIIDAINRGATHLWANTILFGDHPLQTSSRLAEVEKKIRIIGQPPHFVEAFDDKNLVNSWLRRQGGFTLPYSMTVKSLEALDEQLTKDRSIGVPLVAKPIRGRGSHGVKVCFDLQQLRDHVQALLDESPEVMIEQFLCGEEITVTVMPPSDSNPSYWAMPVVARFNHQDSIAPYNGAVAVTENSRAISDAEAAADPAYRKIAQECERVAELLQCTAPIRVDCRRVSEAEFATFALFDVNMKPVSMDLDMGRPATN